MPFKKGQVPGPNVFKKGQSGNPKGTPRKMCSVVGGIGYTKAEAANTINTMLAMTLAELKLLYENENSTVLEKTIAGALRKSLEKGSLYSLDTLLSRTHGKPTEMVDMNSTGEVIITVKRQDNGGGYNIANTAPDAADGGK